MSLVRQYICFFFPFHGDLIYIYSFVHAQTCSSCLASIIYFNKSHVSVHSWHACLSHHSFSNANSISKSGFISCNNKLIDLYLSLYDGCNFVESHRSPFLT